MIKFGEKRLCFESASSFEEGATFTTNKEGGIGVAVAEEQAVDSYNQSFTCHDTLDRAQAIQLRDWLIAHIK